MSDLLPLGPHVSLFIRVLLTYNIVCSINFTEKLSLVDICLAVECTILGTFVATVGLRLVYCIYINVVIIFSTLMIFCYLFHTVDYLMSVVICSAVSFCVIIYHTFLHMLVILSPHNGLCICGVFVAVSHTHLSCCLSQGCCENKYYFHWCLSPSCASHWFYSHC